MAEQTVTIWSCGRCKQELTLPPGDQPNDWKRLYGATPPRSADKQNLGDLCDVCWPIVYSFATNPNA